MKYIRTKDNIIECDNLPYCGEKTRGYSIVGDIANTIEELCDEFLLEEDFEKHKFWMTDRLKEVFDVIEFYCMKPRNIYGAIWTDKGLIYVAKMNDKGELELL